MLFNRSILVGACLSIFCVASATAQQPPAGAPAGTPTGTPTKEKKPFVFSIPVMKYAEDVPVNFPISAYPSNVVKKRFISSVSGAPSASAMILTKDRPDVVYDWYKNLCKQNGWNFRTPSLENSTKMTKTGTPVYMIEAKKEKQNVMIFCMPDKTVGGTSVQISWTKDKYQRQ